MPDRSERFTVSGFRPLLLLAGALCCAGASVAQSTIDWGPPQDTSGPGDVAPGGAVVVALNGLVFVPYQSDNPTYDTTVGGVLFDATNFLGAQFPNEPPGSFIANHTSGDPAYDTLLANASSCDGPTLGNGSSNDNANYVVSGLTPGESYRVQVWYTDVRGFSNMRSVTVDGAVTIESGINSDPNDLGQFAVGTFTASAATQLINIDAAGTSNRAAISAILVRVDTGAAIGGSYCGPAVVNSSGGSASITAFGSESAAVNDVTLTATALPLNAFGFFLTSQDQASIVMPGGSQGTLCLGGSIGRYVGSGQILNSGGAGEISLAVDLTQHPQPTGPVSVMAGQTWNFQAWFRDSVGGTATSNFSDAVEVTFN